MLLVALAVVSIAALLSFPFEPVLSVFQRLVAVLAIGTFFGGLLLLLLARPFGRRVAGMQAMAAASLLVLIFFRSDGGAWFVASAGAAVSLGMAIWGRLLFRSGRAVEGEVRREAPDP